MTEKIEKVSKRLLIALGVFGLCAIFSVIGLGIGFFKGWELPEFMTAFLTTFCISITFAFVMGVLEWLKKEWRNRRVHDREMLELQLKNDKKKEDK